MNIWLAIVVIVAILACADTLKKNANARAKKALGDAESEELLARIDKLEERVRVLERIVTQEGHSLRREISKL